MSRIGTGALLRRRGRPPRRAAVAIVAVAAAATSLGIAWGGPTEAHAADGAAPALTALTALTAPRASTALTAPAAVPTRAAIDPSLTAGRGASVGFVEQNAFDAVTNGTIIGPGTAAYTLQAEATGREAVTLDPGQYVEFTLPGATNAITVRYSIPDAPDGGGITSPLDVTVNGRARHVMTLTSRYAWLYNEYPFTNDPNASVLHPDWWATECGCVPDQTTPAPVFPAPFRPNHFYDEQRLLLGHTYREGDKLRLTVPAAAAVTTIDVLDSQLVAPPEFDPRALNVVAFGADPTGARDSADAFDRAVAFAQRVHLPVYIPPGTFQVDRHIIVDNVTIEGAGNWYSVVTGHQVTLGSPLPDGSIHTGVGFYGRYAADGGSRDVHLSDFAIIGDVRERVDTDQVNGIGGALSDSSVEGLYIDHTKVGMWLDGPMDDLTIKDNEIVNQIADGVNLHSGVTNSLVENNFVRNTGDDGLAMWSETAEDANDTLDHNTVQTNVLANGIALYGGTDNTVSDNLVADPLREGSGIQLGSRFNARPFTGHAWITDNTTVRAGTYELNWKIGLGAIWIYALQGDINADVEVTGDHLLDNTYNALMLVSDFSVRNQYSITNVHFRDIEVDGTGTSVVSARTAGSATFQNVVARSVGAVGVNNCGSFNFPSTGSEFTVDDLGGNTGGGTTGPWLAPWELPNTITCADNPAVVPPPPPSPWS